MTVWTEPWQSTSAWEYVTPSGKLSTSNGILVMPTNSSELLSRQRWRHDEPWALDVRLRASDASGHGRFYGAVGWWESEQNYATIIAAQRMFTGQRAPLVGFFGEVANGGILDVAKPYVPDTWLDLRLTWDGRRNAKYWVNGMKGGRVRLRPPGPLRVVIVSSAVTEGQPNKGEVSRVELGPLTVTGTPL